jgi:hypothetical protein
MPETTYVPVTIEVPAQLAPYYEKRAQIFPLLEQFNRAIEDGSVTQIQDALAALHAATKELLDWANSFEHVKNLERPIDPKVVFWVYALHGEASGFRSGYNDIVRFMVVTAAKHQLEILREPDKET